MRRLACALVLILSLASLSAGTLNVGLIQVEETDSFATSLLESLFSLLPANSRLERINYSRFEAETLESAEEALHSALAAEREVSSQRAAEYTSYTESSPVYKITEINVSDDFARDQNSSMLSYQLMRNSLDLIFAFIFTPEDGLSNLDVYIYIEGAVAEVYSRLYPTGGLWNIEGELLSRLVSFFTQDYVLLDLSAFPYSRIFDQTTGDEILKRGSWALVPRTCTGIVVRTNGYEDLLVDFDLSGETGVHLVQGHLEEVSVGQVSVQAHPASATARLFGLDVSLPLETGFHSGAVLLTIGAEGFRNENLQLTPSSGYHSVTLRPEWMARDGLILQAKDGMYRSLRNSLLSFGLYVIMSSIANIYPEAGLWSDVASGLAMGISVVNLFDFIHDCLAYYNSAKQVYR